MGGLGTAPPAPPVAAHGSSGKPSSRCRGGPPTPTAGSAGGRSRLFGPALIAVPRGTPTPPRRLHRLRRFGRLAIAAVGAARPVDGRNHRATGGSPHVQPR